MASGDVTPDEHAHRFLGSGVEGPQKFEALSSQGSGKFVGLETFPNPGCGFVWYTSDEVVSACPQTGQPDYYVCEIALRNAPKLIESKSLKLYFNMLHEMALKGEHNLFCENLAVYLRDMFAEVTEAGEDNVMVTLTQKSRGGIVIKAQA